MLRFLLGTHRRCGADVSVVDTDTPPGRIQVAHPRLQHHQPTPDSRPSEHLRSEETTQKVRVSVLFHDF